jgi:hypothetical protein
LFEKTNWVVPPRLPIEFVTTSRVNGCVVPAPDDWYAMTGDEPPELADPDPAEYAWLEPAILFTALEIELVADDRSRAMLTLLPHRNAKTAIEPTRILGINPSLQAPPPLSSRNNCQPIY